MPGDFDLDGKVVAADLNVLGVNWQKVDLTSYAQGDANGDGRANATDLNEVAAGPIHLTIPAQNSRSVVLSGRGRIATG